MFFFGVRVVEIFGKGKGLFVGVDVVKFGVDFVFIYMGKGMFVMVVRDEVVVRIGFGIGFSVGVGVVVVGSVGRVYER